MGIAIESDKEKYIHEFTSNFHFTGPNDINNKHWNVRTKINANEKKVNFIDLTPDVVKSIGNTKFKTI